MPNGQLYLLYWSPYAYDAHSGVDHYLTTYYCDGGKKQSSYTEYLNWTNIDNLYKFTSSTGSNRCHQQIKAVDAVGNVSAILSYTEYINRT